MIAIEQADRGVTIRVRVRAGARRSGVVGELDGALRIDVTAAPERGKANRAVAEVLADVLRVARSAIELVSGAANANKRFLAVGVAASEAQRRIAAALDGA